MVGSGKLGSFRISWGHRDTWYTRIGFVSHFLGDVGMKLGSFRFLGRGAGGRLGSFRTFGSWFVANWVCFA